MYSNFDEIVDNMITPEMNGEEFLKLLLTSEPDRVGKGLLLTQNFNYNLNPNNNINLNLLVDNVRFKARVFLKSIDKLSPEEKRAKETTITNPNFISFMKFLSELSYETYWKLCGITRLFQL